MAINQGEKVRRVYGDDYLEKFETRFYRMAYERRDELKAVLTKKFEDFFPHMARLMGRSHTPAPVARMGVHWSFLTEDWRVKKVQKGVTDDLYDNKYYRGLKNQFVSFWAHVKNLDANDEYGAPEVFVQRAGKKQADGTKVKTSEISRLQYTYRYRGTLAKADKLFSARIGFRMTPLVTSEEQYLDAFGTGMDDRDYAIMASNEERRPFLKPMLDYYQELVLPREFRKVIDR